MKEARRRLMYSMLSIAFWKRERAGKRDRCALVHSQMISGRLLQERGAGRWEGMTLFHYWNVLLHFFSTEKMAFLD